MTPSARRSNDRYSAGASGSPAVMGHDGTRPGAAGQDEVAEQDGVPAVVRTAEADRDPLGEERGPGHRVASVRVPLGAPGEVLLGVHADDPEVTGRVDQAGEVGGRPGRGSPHRAPRGRAPGIPPRRCPPPHRPSPPLRSAVRPSCAVRGSARPGRPAGSRSGRRPAHPPCPADRAPRPRRRPRRRPSPASCTRRAGRSSRRRTPRRSNPLVPAPARSRASRSRRRRPAAPGRPRGSVPGLTRHRDAVGVGVGHPQQLGLRAAVRAHAGVAVRRPEPSWAYPQAGGREPRERS